MIFQFILASVAFIPDEKGELAALDSVDSVPQMPPGDYGAAFAKMFLTFFALVILLAATFWFLRRMIRLRLQKGSSDASIQILEKRMLSPKTMLYLVEIENKRVLIAESHLEVKKIETLDQQQP